MSGSVEDELQELKQQLQQQHRGGRAPPRDQLRTFLKLSREARLGNAEDVARFGALLLQHHKLAEDESWLVHEQVSFALLECGDAPSALPLIKAVLLKFPGSVRARRLQGLYYEAVGKQEMAKQLYDEVLAERPHNTLLPKRLAALHRSCGDLPLAIDVLRVYLQHYSNDQGGWEELADCYLEACQYQQAAFCLEEVLTMNPLSPQVLVRYADVLATLGSPSQLKAARAYYSQALRVSGGRSARALFGIVYVAGQLSDKEAASSSAAAQELPAAAAAMLLQLYGDAAPQPLQAAARAALACLVPQ